MPMCLNWPRFCMIINVCFIFFFYTSDYVLKKMFYAGKCHRRQFKKKTRVSKQKTVLYFCRKRVVTMGNQNADLQTFAYCPFFFYLFLFFFPAISRPFGHARKNILPDQIILHNLSWFTTVPAWGVPSINV